MDINGELNNILVKHGVRRNISAEGLIRDFLAKNPMDDWGVVGLYGVGIEADNLLHFVSQIEPEIKVDYCFDSSVRKYQFKDYIKDESVKTIDKLDEYPINTMIIGSKVYSTELKSILCDKKFDGVIIDFFEVLKEWLYDNFTDYKDLYNLHAILGELSNNRAEVIKELIKGYINIRDFINAKKYMAEYITKQYEGYEEYIYLEKDLEELLSRIRSYISVRNRKDIIINWVDAVPYNKIQNFHYLSEISNESVFFENAYTVMPWTRGTMRTILYGEYPIEDKHFLKPNFHSKESKLIRRLKNKDYRFAYCGWGIYARNFDDDVLTAWDVYSNKNTSSVKEQWNALSLICSSDEPLCIIIHSMPETHGPYICGEVKSFVRFSFKESDWSDERCIEQARISGDYIDEQLRYYNSFYGDKAVCIYMSDHGNVGDCIMEDHKVHVMLMIKENGIAPCRVKKMFSLIDFDSLIGKVLDQKTDWDSITSGHVFVENYDAYSEKAVAEVLEGKLNRRDWLQCRGIITETDKFFLFADGEMFYFIGSDEKKNMIEESSRADRIAYLRNLCNKPFINIYDYQEFEKSRKLYQKGI